MKIKSFNEDLFLWEVTFYYIADLGGDVPDSVYMFPALDFDDALQIAKEFCGDKKIITGLVEKSNINFFDVELGQ